MRKGTNVVVRMPRGLPRTGKVVAEHTGANGAWLEIKPPGKDAVTFRCRPACASPA